MLLLINSYFFFSEAAFSIECALTKPQQANLVVILTSLFLLSSLTLTTITVGWAMTFTVNWLFHFFRWGLAYLGMQNSTCRVVIDDTIEYHSTGYKRIADVYWLFDPLEPVSTQGV